ncbi:unnamed protein product [Caenorhabditis brenneri]
MTEDIVPAEYGEALYYERSFCSKDSGVDVLVYVMYAQEYPRLQEKQWLVVDNTNSVAYVEPRKMSGYVFGEAKKFQDFCGNQKKCKKFTIVCEPLNGYTNGIRDMEVTFNKSSLEDKENVHPSTSHRNGTIMGKVKNGDKNEQVLMLFNSARAVAGDINKYCNTAGCQTPAGDRYREQNTDKQVYCIKCNNEKFKSEEERQENLQSWTVKMILNTVKEETRTCSVRHD